MNLAAVPGITVGHTTIEAHGTGCTVVLAPESGLRAAVCVRGRATGTRELDVMDPRHLVERIDAILFTGGSALGLGAADGVMRWLREPSVSASGERFSFREVPVVPRPAEDLDETPGPEVVVACTSPSIIRMLIETWWPPKRHDHASDSAGVPKTRTKYVPGWRVRSRSPTRIRNPSVRSRMFSNPMIVETVA